MNRRSAAFAAAAIFAALTLCPSAQAGFDFDQGGIDAKRTVGEIRQAAGQSSQALPPSGAVQAGLAAASPDQLSRRIIVFKKGTPAKRQMGIAEVSGGVVVNKLWLIDALTIVVPKAHVQAADAGLRSNSEVLRVEEDYYQNWLAADEPHDPPPVEPAAQKIPWGIARVNAKGAWSITRGAGVKVAVVDTGIDFTHPDLKVAGGFNVITHDDNFKDDQGHGTHVSGTIAGQGNGEGVFGVAPDVALYGVKVLDANGSGSFSDVIEGIQWAAKNKMDVANFSLGASQGTQALEDAVNAAAKDGLTIVAAAGNSGGSVGYPAAYSGVIAVSASDSKDKIAYFSSRGPQVAVIAPGVAIESTYMGGGYKKLDGTSMACPHVAGLAALAVAAQGLHGAESIRAALQKAATPLAGLSSDEQGSGLVDAAKLVGKE